MEANLAAEPGVAEPSRSFPPSNWGPWVAIVGVIAALGTGVVLAIPALAFHHTVAASGGGTKEELTTLGNVIAQIATAIGFLGAPIAVALSRGARTPREVADRLGLRSFAPSALRWMAAAVVAYLVFAAIYANLIVEPEQKDIAEGFGAIPVQILLIVIAAPISEEICFRGMLYGGLRERLPKIAAALLCGLVFGALHAITGITAVPPLIVFGALLALLYEKTGSIVPGIMLHMLNNSVALIGQ